MSAPALTEIVKRFLPPLPGGLGDVQAQKLIDGLSEHYHLLPRVQVCPDVETDYFSTEGNGLVEVPDLDPSYVHAEIDDHLSPNGARCAASALASAADLADENVSRQEVDKT
ncbi:hypothetical protein SEA_SCENTAE_232 [Gordonia phage SCentae]|nr:hypothetical protein SEA_SCENTAE_232 [Gordonia phage SCentae]